TALLAQYAVQPSCLKLEITEAALTLDAKRTHATLIRLREVGVRLAIDDFGSGYFSLAQLKRLPVNEIKIDKSFVVPLLVDEADAAIVRSTIELAHNLRMAVVAEGVEDEPTRARLATLG